MHTLQNLNALGQISLAFISNALVNIVVHPFCTLKNRLMVHETCMPRALAGKKSLTVFSLYKGYTAICLTESLAYAISLFANGWLRKRDVSSLNASILAGITSAPLIAIGEGFMLERQIPREQGPTANHPLYLAATLTKAISPSSLLATIMRELPYSVALLAATPAFEAHMPFANDAANSFLAGSVPGSMAGALTAPMDIIKTRVQVYQKPLYSITEKIFYETLTSSLTRQMLLGATAFRAINLGLGLGLLNVTNKKLAPFAPKAFICPKGYP